MPEMHVVATYSAMYIVLYYNALIVHMYISMYIPRYLGRYLVSMPKSRTSAYNVLYLMYSEPACRSLDPSESVSQLVEILIPGSGP